MLKNTGIALFIFCLLCGHAFGWGNDVTVWSGGQVNCFDAEYALDGTMFVAFQEQGNNQIKVLTSSDHGLTWSEYYSFDAGRGDVARIRLLYNESPGGLDLFYVDLTGKLVSLRIPVPISAYSAYSADVSSNPILEESFDVAQDMDSGIRYATYSEGNNAGDTAEIVESPGSSLSWSGFSSWSWSQGAEVKMSIASGPPNRIYHGYAARLAAGTEPAALVYAFADDASVRGFTSTATTLKNYDPRVCAANVNDSGVWMLFNRDQGGHEIDLHYLYSGDGGVNWSAEAPISNVAGVDEYIADIKYYKSYPNQWVDMVYIYDDPAGNPVRKAIWTYTSTTDPTNWRGTTEVNDSDIRSWPESVAPRLVYSPGAPASGGGVVFTYQSGGLYFDAPWVTNPVQHQLTVIVTGSGNVVSSPVGIDCTSTPPAPNLICSAMFNDGETVTLTPTPIDGADYTASFAEWSGACTGSGSCVITMDADKNVTATFAAVGIPVYALPVPAGQDVYSYLPVETPLTQPDPADCKPFAVGDVAGGTLSLSVGLPFFSGPVDIYLALQAPDVNPDIFIITPGPGMQSLNDGLVPWMSNTSGDIYETLFGDIPTMMLPPATYNLYLVVTPTGSTSTWYFYSTYFIIP